jgi:hypothetical protein
VAAIRSFFPPGLRRRRPQGGRYFPDLPAVAEVHGWFFPQVNGRSRRLRLSRQDQTLLDFLHPDEWVRPHAFVRDKRFFDEFYLLIFWEMVTDRLHAWATHRADDPAVLSRKVEGVSSWTHVAYRLTARGERIRRSGLEQADEAPPQFIGGCCVYSGRNPWVRRNRGQQWQIDRLHPRTAPR